MYKPFVKLPHQLNLQASTVTKSTVTSYKDHAELSSRTTLTWRNILKTFVYDLSDIFLPTNTHDGYKPYQQDWAKSPFILLIN